MTNTTKTQELILFNFQAGRSKLKRIKFCSNFASLSM